MVWVTTKKQLPEDEKSQTEGAEEDNRTMLECSEFQENLLSEELEKSQLTILDLDWQFTY